MRKKKDISKIQPEQGWRRKRQGGKKKSDMFYKRINAPSYIYQSDNQLIALLGDEMLLESFTFGKPGQWGLARKNNFGIEVKDAS